MTILYKPVLISSAEQAEALPIGTIFHDEDLEWRYTRRTDGSVRFLFRDIKAGVRVTALVPIEAEEERTRPVQLYISAVHVAPPSSATKPSRRYVTPWEEA